MKNRCRFRSPTFVVCATAVAALTASVALSPNVASADTAGTSVATTEVNGLSVTTTTFADGSTVMSTGGETVTETPDNTDTTDAAGEIDGGFAFGDPNSANDANTLSGAQCNAPSEYDQLVAEGVSATEAKTYAQPVDMGAGCSSTTDTNAVPAGSDGGSEFYDPNYTGSGVANSSTHPAKRYFIHDHCKHWKRADKRIRGFGCDTEYRVGPVHSRTVDGGCGNIDHCPETQIAYNVMYKMWEVGTPMSGASKGISGLLEGIDTPDGNYIKDFYPKAPRNTAPCGSVTVGGSFGLQTGSSQDGGVVGSLTGSLSMTQPECPEQILPIQYWGGKFSSKWDGNHHGYSTTRATEGVSHWWCSWASACQGKHYVYWWMQ